MFISQNELQMESSLNTQTSKTQAFERQTEFKGFDYTFQTWALSWNTTRYLMFGLELGLFLSMTT